MQTLLIIQELHGLARDSIHGYEKVLAAWAGRPEAEEIENQQISRRVVLHELRKTIERHKGDANGMAQSDGYRAINERTLTGHPSEMRGVLDDLLRGENFYLYRIDDARTRYPALAAHLSEMQSTIRGNRDILSAFLAREESISSISIAHPGGIEDEALEAPAAAVADEPAETLPIEDRLTEVSSAPVPLPPAYHSHENVQASDAEIPPSFRESAAGETLAVDDADMVDPLPADHQPEPAEALGTMALDKEDILEVSRAPVEGPVMRPIERRPPETEIDLLPTHAFDYDLDARPLTSITGETEFDVDDSVSDISQAGLALERRLEAAIPHIEPLDPAGGGKRNIMTRRGRFDPDAVRADANEVENAVSQI